MSPVTKFNAYIKHKIIFLKLKFDVIILDHVPDKNPFYFVNL